MNKLELFIDYLLEQYNNRSIYIWGGQGQGYPTLDEDFIRNRESGEHEKDALSLYQKRVSEGYKEKMRAFDCSGLGMYFLQNLHKIYTSDLTANSMLGKCDKITKAQLKLGDWVFRTYNNGKAYHIGYVIDNNLTVIEAKGRAYGVVKVKFDSNYWNTYGRPHCFKKYIEDSEESAPIEFDRNLKKGMTGEDVKELQKLLNQTNITPALDVDGIFGLKTQSAVIDFQYKYGLAVDGIAGPNTIALLQRYDDDIYDGEPITNYSFQRIIKRTTPLMEGEDIHILKEYLRLNGYLETNTKKTFGNQSEEAVKAYQKKKGLVVDGIFGKNTCTSMRFLWKG